MSGSATSQRVRPRHQGLADPLLQGDEQLADPVEVPFQLPWFGADVPAGVGEGERKVVPDVGV
ncbi:hypothetical protein GCM10020221_28810 [Streptomyces thioluteus]|uniref:Uncharacterized protein n=1 Tax=Streptomyces thioluteus TaxID=66431 RepID=A0ABN3WXT2_STRTU